MPHYVNSGYYNITNSSAYFTKICFQKYDYFPPYNTSWHIQDPLIRKLPVLSMQLGVAILVMRMFLIVLKPLRQPRFVAEVAVSSTPQL